MPLDEPTLAALDGWAHQRGVHRPILHPGTSSAKAEKAVAGKAPVKRNRFVRLAGGAHLSIVFAALAITRLIEDRTGW